MSKPFDLEAAKRGEPVEYLYGSAWEPAYFVGTSPDGNPVIVPNSRALIVEAKCLRMAEKPAEKPEVKRWIVTEQSANHFYIGLR